MVRTGPNSGPRGGSGNKEGEREEEGKGKGWKDAFMPFGSGPRNCLAQPFAILQTLHVTARILITFEKFELKDEHVPFQEAAAVTYYNRRGTWIRFT